MATVLLPRHAVLIGDNNTGKTTLLEALDLVLGPDRLNRQPPIDEHDFFRGNYLAEDVEAAGVAVEDVGTDAEVGTTLPWCINTGKSLIPLTLLFLHQKRNLLIPLELSRVMHQGSPAARNTLDSARIPRASKLLICGLFQKGRVLAQDAVVSKNTNELKTRTPPISSLVRGDAVRRLMETKSERGRRRGFAYSVVYLKALR